ncbi:MAG: DUF1015 domain-containing protein [bacterium]|nr:DUF1015 domain-containing protein [bacterium]
MVEVLPFRGILYNQEKISDLRKVVTPPYDVISKEEQEMYLKRSEYNIIRIILSKDNGDRYKRAATVFHDWLKKEVLIEDNQEAIYVYEQEYFYKHKRKRRGFIAKVKLEDYESRKIIPHEKTLSKPKEDRLNLLRETRANLSPIFSLYEDKDNRIGKILESEEEPIIDIKTWDGIIQRLYAIKDMSKINDIRHEMLDKPIFIADGHHRYEVSLNFRNEMKGTSDFRDSYNYVMMYLTPMDQESLTILPAHRLIKNIVDVDMERIAYLFEIEESDKEKMFKEMIERGKLHHVFGMYTKGRCYLLTLRSEGLLDKIIENKPKEWKSLDVVILHSILINHIYGVRSEDDIKYVISEEKTIELVDRGEYQVAFFVNPTKIEQIKEVTSLGLTMPGKATYFYPKLLTGLVLRKL